MSEFKSASQSRVAPGSVIFSRCIASEASAPASVSGREAEMPSVKRKRSVASRGVQSQFLLRKRECQPKATSPGRPITPKSVLSSALLKARRVARVELFASIASRLAALKVPVAEKAAVKLRPVALRQRSRLLS